MPFDSTKPVEGTPVDAAEMRNQLNGLNDLINSVPTGSAMNEVLTAQTAGPCGQLDYLDLQPSDPPTQADLVAVIKQLNDFLALTRRE